MNDLDIEQRAETLRGRMVGQLAASGQLTDPVWEKIFTKVARHTFVPEFFAATDGTLQHIGPSHPRWLDLVYQDDALVTQMTGGIATSSSTAPGLMAQMLEALSIEDGNQVMEVATGTGYNAGLLCERLGSGLVTTVEVDPVLARTAEDRLHLAGYTPRVAVGDGRQGHPQRAHSDRLIATCGFTQISYAWVEQVRAGGVIVSPLGSGTVRLVVDNQGGAIGRFLPAPSFFMAARTHGATGTAPHPGRPEQAQHSIPRVDLAAVLGDDQFRFLASLTAPDTAWSHETDEHDRVAAVELWTADGSWARATPDAVLQAGPRRVWDAIERSHDLYEVAGRPSRQEFGVTVTPDEQRLWVGDERHVIQLADQEGAR